MELHLILFHNHQHQHHDHQAASQAEEAAQEPVKAPHQREGDDVVQQVDHQARQHIQRDLHDPVARGQLALAVEVRTQLIGSGSESVKQAWNEFEY